MKSKLINFTVPSTLRVERPLISTRRGSIVHWGNNNLYPEWIESLYWASTSHQTVMDKYIRLISGGGWNVGEDNPRVEEFFQNSDASDHDLNDILNKMAREWAFWNSVCLKIIPNRVGEIARIEVLPIKNVRMVTPDDLLPESVEEIQYCEDWSNRIRTEIITYPKFDPKRRIGESYYWIGEKRGFYPEPSYLSAQNEMITEHKISKYYLRVVENGFNMGKMITFNDGTPTDEEKDDIIRQFKEQCENPDKAGTNLFWFTDDKESAPTIQAVQEDNLDKKYKDLLDKLEKNIMKAHGIVNPILYGIRVQSGLTSGKEIIDSLAVEQAINISPIQSEFAQHINYLASFSGIEGMEINPFMIEVSEMITNEEIITILTTEGLSRDQKIRLLERGGLSLKEAEMWVPEEIVQVSTDKNNLENEN